MNLRPYEESDLREVTQVFVDAVHEGAAQAYSEAQRVAWAPRPPDLDFWRDRLGRQHTLVADMDSRIAGFIAHDDAGHIDLLFTAPGLVRKGVASALYSHVEKSLAARGVRELYTEASLVARPFFARQGFVVIDEEHVVRNGVEMVRFRMQKRLTAPPVRADGQVRSSS